MSVWTLNGITLEEWGISIASGQFTTQDIDTVEFVRAANFDSAAGLAYRDPVTLAKDGVPYFQGRVMQTPRMASPEREEIAYVVAGPWWALEETVYEQEWGVGPNLRMLPVVTLGQRADGTRISTMQQVADIVQYAADNGANLQLGGVADGPTTWPVEVENVMCAEAIRQMLRWSPQVVAWFDYTTSPPTLNFTKRADLGSIGVSVGDNGNAELINIRSRDDLVPTSVSIVYRTANVIDGVVYRSIRTDTAPEEGATSGPGVLRATVELEGTQMQFQKQRVETRTLPTDATTALTWLGLKYPAIKALTDASVALAVTDFDRSVVDDTADLAPPINPNATRLPVSEPADLPRELVRGSIEDWMRKKVGQVRIKLQIRYAGTEALIPEDVKKVLGPDGKRALDVVVTSTDAITKTYTGLANWTPGEDAPAGVAAAVYAQLSDLQWEGSVTVVAEELASGTWVGRGLGIYGASAAYETINAIIHSASWDVETGKVTVSFGPPPHLAPQDLVELQRMIRSNPTKWYSVGERSSSLLGREDKAGSKGDTIGGYDVPMTAGLPGTPVMDDYQLPFMPLIKQGEAPDEWTAAVTPGQVIERIPGTGNAISQHDPSGMTGGGGEPSYQSIEDGDTVICKVDVAASGAVTAAAIEVTSESLESTHYAPAGGTSSGSSGTYRYPLFKFNVVEAQPKVKIIMGGSHIDHWRDLPKLENRRTGGGENIGRIFQKFDDAEKSYFFRDITKKADTDTLEITEQADYIELKTKGANLDLTVWDIELIHEGEDQWSLVRTGAGTEKHYWRDGLYKGKSTPEDPEGIDIVEQDVANYPGGSTAAPPPP